MAGYSKTALIRKLGIRAGQRIHVSGEPRGYWKALGALPEGTRALARPGRDMDFIHVFHDARARLERAVPSLARTIAADGMLWISWPKKASGVTTDVDEGVVRRAGLGAGLVDVKICAVDETWSGLKFVRRLKDRR